MTGNEYQFLAARTINYNLTDKEKEMHIRALIIQPENAGDKSRVLSWLLRKWEEEQNG